MIALLYSVQSEAELLLSKTAVKKTVTLGSKTIIEGTIGNRTVLLCAGGMGKVNAAHSATLLLTRYAPEALVIFGIGGAYPQSGAQIGDVALAEEEVAGDEGVLTLEGFKDARCIGIPLLKTTTSSIFNVFPAPRLLLRRAVQELVANGYAGRVKTGTFVTLSACTGTSTRAKELEKQYNGLCENMEGAAAAQVALSHNMQWLEVRGISNLVEDRDLAKWDIPRACEAVQKAVIHILEGWEGCSNAECGMPNAE
jgi:futalosine hydrolase